jgi:hypothetical protein
LLVGFETLFIEMVERVFLLAFCLTVGDAFNEEFSLSGMYKIIILLVGFKIILRRIRMEGIIGAIIVAIITTVVQWKIASKEREIREGERKDKFKLAALDKRMDIHQEAYYRWSKIIHLRFKNDVDNVLLESVEWYNKNCLFLDSKSRVEFIRCTENVLNYKTTWRMWQDSAQQNLKEKEDYSNELKTMFNQIIGTGDYIAKGVDLNYESVKDIREKLQIDKD